jgi:hypothetical protein
MSDRLLNSTSIPVKLVDNKDGSYSVATSLSGSLPITQVELVSSNTTIVNGGNYVSPTQAIDRGSSLLAYYRLSSAQVSSLSLTWMDAAGTTAVGSDSLIASGSRTNGVGRVTGGLNKKFQLVISNGAGADITLTRAGYSCV